MMTNAQDNLSKILQSHIGFYYDQVLNEENPQMPLFAEIAKRVLVALEKPFTDEYIGATINAVKAAHRYFDNEAEYQMKVWELADLIRNQSC